MDDAQHHAHDPAVVVTEPEPPQPPGGAPRWAVIGIFLLMMVGALAYARAFLMPVVLALMLSLVFSPLRRFLDKRGLPSGVSAFVIVGSLVAAVAVGLMLLSGPATEWVRNAPQIGRQLEFKIRDLRDAAEGMRQAAEKVDELASNGKPAPGEQTVVVKDPGVAAAFAATAPSMLAQVGLTLILLYFVLASGEMIYEKIVHVLPTFKDKRRAIRIAHDIERRLSRYLSTITVINAGLGTCIGLAMWWFGMPEPLLFGVLGFFLNYIPYLGAIAGIGIATVVALVSLPLPGQALVVGATYLALTSVEGQLITPYFVGRSLQLNTVVVFLSVTLWAWLWSVVGMIVATPLLVSFRVLCEHIPALNPMGHFLSARGAESIDETGTEAENGKAPNRPHP